MSATNSAIKVRLESKSGVSIVCELKRHLAPSVVGSIARALPLSGNAHKMGTAVIYFETQIQSGMQRSRTEFRRGEIAYYPAEGSICFMHKDIKVSHEMSAIGVMPNYDGELAELGSGDVLTLATGA